MRRRRRRRRRRRKNHPLRGFQLIGRLRRLYGPFYNIKFVNLELKATKYAYYSEWSAGWPLQLRRPSSRVP